MEKSINHLANLLRFAQLRGVDPTHLCRLAGLELERIEAGAAVDPGAANALWRNAMRLTGDPLLGLHLGEFHQLAALGLVGQLVQTSPTVEAALRQACQFIRLLTDAFHMEFEKGPERSDIAFIPDPFCREHYADALNQSLDSAMVFTVREYETLTLGRLAPVEVRMAKAAPVRTSEYRRIFRCPVTFDAPRFLITIDNDDLDRPVIGADYALHDLLMQHADRLLSGLPPLPVTSRAVQAALLNQSRGPFPGIEDVAGLFNTSVRSLQRKLRAEGSSFQTILEEVKKSFALHYLRQDVPAKEVSYLLGYNEVSAFTRSFKRWTGQTPRAFQRRK